MTIEITEKKEEEKPQPEDIKETLKAADEYTKVKEETERLEAMYARNQEIKAKIALGGKAEAGNQEKSPEEKAAEEAAKHLKLYGYVPSN